MYLARSQEWPEGRDAEVRDHFNRALDERERKDRGEYIKAVVVALDGVLTQHEMAARIGLSGAPAIQQMMKGKVSPKTFDDFRFLIGSLAPNVPVPDAAKDAMIATIKRFRAIDEEAITGEQFEREEYECLELVQGSRIWLQAQIHENQEALRSEAGAILQKVHLCTMVGTKRVNGLPELLRLMDKWQWWYVRCKAAVLRFPV